ncbi:efflux RND transporter periplasmic adaptor subunit [Pseudomonas turukhanskensis]|uniref:Acriflavin resistance protein n=1 Tax=Pseudomonas turukhanskensis TaxID=1806536 RepID=A0A9W6NHG6_9PSED|nr:efflux RND transporter periplasmic adaptor subunit [Pseudomonas turukhanskensis]GLK90882.1 acriflavin resistance protein [Pseudomonas turukhanskensis]
MNRAIHTILLVLTSGVLAGCGQSADMPSTVGLKIWNLSTFTVAAVDVPIDYTTVGSVVSDQRIEVTSKVSGYIHELQVREGDRVQRGEIIAKLDGANIEGDIRQSRAELSAANSAFADAQIDFERFKRLYERGYISEYEWRKIRLKRDVAKELLNQAQAVQETVDAQRAYIEIRSPGDGVVVARLKRAGDMAQPGEPMLILEVGRTLLFDTSVSEAHVAAIAVGSSVRVKIDVLPQVLQGMVSRIVPSGDPVSRSYQLKIALPNTKNLLPGMFGRASFVIGDSQAVLIPPQALVERGGLRGVFLVDDAGLASFRWLRTGREWPKGIEVAAGLLVGEQIVAVVAPGLREGDRITSAEHP